MADLISLQKPCQYEYFYPERQPSVCSSTKILNDCSRTHEKAKNNGKIFTRLVLNVGKTPCFCPPPEPAVKPAKVDVETVTAKQNLPDYYWGNNVGILTGFNPY